MPVGFLGHVGVVITAFFFDQFGFWGTSQRQRQVAAGATSFTEGVYLGV
jgi:hypothetical protein